MRQARWTPPALLAAATVCIVAVKGYPCGSPGQPLHGIVRPRSQLFYAGENVTVTCEPGFVRFGEFSRACTPDGTWHGLMPFCSRNVAYLGSTQGPALPLGPPIELGQFEPRLAADGDARTCSSTPPHVRERWWQVRLPSRTHVESVGLVVRPGYSLDVSIFIISLNTQQPDSANYQQCANFTGVQLEAKRLFYCGSQGLMGEYVYIRDEKRRPDYLTLCEVEVFAFGDERGCGEPEQPAYGQMTRTDANTATYRCHSGYRLAGHRQRRCVNGYWTGQQPVCRKIFCERPPALANGHLDVSVPSLARHPYNATVRYRCSAGYIMQGEPGLRTCAVNGRWSGRMPHCQPLVCPMPPKYPHARYELLNGTTRWQAMVEYSCEEGFVLSPDSGPVLTQCQELASWQPVPVNITCEPAPPPVAPDLGQDGAGTGRGLTVTSEQHEPMSSGVVAGIGVVAVIAIAAMIIVGIFCTRKRVWKRRKRSGPPGTGPVLPPADVKTYDQVYEPSYQNVLESAPPALLSFRAAGSPRPSSLEPERPRGRPIEPPYETLKARLAADAAPPDDAYEPIAGGRLYDDVAPEPNPYQSLPPAAGEPDYETLAVSRSAVRAPDEGDYDLVPARGYRDYDQVPAASYEDCRFAAGEGAVPDLLKGASAGGEPDIPPEILALYAKVNKSKKRNRDDQGEGEPTDPPSPSSSAASYTRNLIEKFNRLAGTDAEPEAAPRPPPGDDKVQYTQVCAGERGGEVRRPAAEPVVYSAVRPLPPVPPEP